MKWRVFLYLMVGFAAGCAATTPNYKPPSIKGNEPAIVIAGTKAFEGSACLSKILIDGTAAGTLGPYETLVVPSKPGQYFIRWDLGGHGACALKEDLAHRIVTVKDGPLLLKLELSGTAKKLIPIAGAFAQTEARIILEGEE